MDISDVPIESSNSGELMITMLASCVSRMIFSGTGERFWMVKYLGANITGVNPHFIINIA